MTLLLEASEFLTCVGAPDVMRGGRMCCAYVLPRHNGCLHLRAERDETYRLGSASAQSRQGSVTEVEGQAHLVMEVAIEVSDRPA